MGGRCSAPAYGGPVLRPGRYPSCAGVMDVASACTNEEEAMNQNYPVQVRARLDEPLSRWLWLVKWLPAMPRYNRLFFLWVGLSVLPRHRVLRDLGPRPLPPLAVRLQPGGAALVLAGRLLPLQCPGHRPLPAVQPGRGAGLPGDAGHRLPAAAVP